jgi:uncharacterized protein YeaO (DUF488 family)
MPRSATNDLDRSAAPWENRRVEDGGAVTRAVRASHVRLKRAYAPADPTDGLRILVDRLWPRGISKAEARLNGWMKDIAPSPELRTWFDHDPLRWDEFRARYRAEINRHRGAMHDLRVLARSGVITLVYSARDEQHNDAVVLRNAILGRPLLQEPDND